MQQIKKIPNIELEHNGSQISFSIKSMLDIEADKSDQTEIPHRHNYYTIIFISRASGNHLIDFQNYPIESKSVIFINPGQVHLVQVDKNPDGFVLSFTDEFLIKNHISKEFINDLRVFSSCTENPPLKITDSELTELKNLLYQINNEFVEKRINSYELISACLKIFLIKCNRISDTLHENKKPNLDVDLSLVKKFKLQVENNYAKLHKVSNYAEQLFITSKHLNEVIKSGIGKTAKEYIQDRIILEAKRKAHYTDLSLKEIAFSLGYEDQAHFSKVFKNCTQMSFSSYKEMIRKKYNKT